MKKLTNVYTVVFAVIFMLGLFGLIILSSCVTPPLEEMNRALDAVTRAENNADAVTYAPDLLIRARNALVQMQNEADARRFDAARDLAAEAISNAERAIADGRTAAALIRNEARDLIDGLAEPLDETAIALNAARMRGNLMLNIDPLYDDMDLARRNYNEAVQDLSAERFQDAIARGQTVRPLLSNINSRLSGAAQAISRK